MAALLVGAAMPMLALPGAAQAQASAPAERRFDIPAQPLREALILFGAQSGLQVTAAGPLVEGRTSAPISGNLAPAEALSRMLGGTGLTFRFDGGNAVRIEAAPVAADGAITLGPVRVEGASATAQGASLAPPTAEIGTLPPPYAGGQIATGARVGLLGNRSTFDTPYSQTSFTEVLIQDQQARTLSDVLANDSSATIQYPRGAFIELLSIRGFGLSSEATGINGLFGLGPGYATMVAAAERVELTRGPNALLNGVNPFGDVGGSVNLVTKRAPDTPLTRLSMEFASPGQLGGHVDVGRRFGEGGAVGVRLNALYRDGDITFEGQSERVGLASAGLDYRGERLRLSADLIYADRESKGTINGVFVNNISFTPPVPRRNWQQPWESGGSRNITAIARAEFDLADTVTAFAAAGVNFGRTNTILRSVPNLINANGDWNTRYSVFRGRNATYSTEVGIRSQFEVGPSQHNLVLTGAIFEREDGFDFSNVFLGLSNIYNPPQRPKPSFVNPDPTPPRSSASILSSVAIADSVSFFGDKLQAIVGARLQRVQANNYDPATQQLQGSYDEQAITPSVALLFKPFRQLSLYANYIEALSQGATAPDDPTIINRGEVFAPAKTDQIEAGVKLDLGRFGATLGIFRIRRPSERLESANNGQFVFRVDGEQVNQGLEVNAFGEIIPSIRLIGSATYIDAELTRTEGGANDGRRPTAIPKWQATGNVEWDTHFLPNLTLIGRVAYNSATTYSLAGDRSIPGWTRLDMGVRYRVNVGDKPITLRATVENITDRRYWRGVQTGSTALIIAQPRTLLMSASLDF